METLIFHTPHKEIEEGDSKATRRFKRRRATFALKVEREKIVIGLSICNPKDNFSKKEGRTEAKKDPAVFKIINVPEAYVKTGIKDFALKVGKGLLKSFDANQNRYVNKKIELNKK